MRLPKKYLVLVLPIVALAIFYFYRNPCYMEIGGVCVRNDVTQAVLLLRGEKTVHILQLGGNKNALVLATTVFAGKGKKVIVSACKGDICFTNDGNVEVIRKASREEIERIQVPTFVIVEGEEIWENNGKLYVGDKAVWPALNLLFPDAERVLRMVSERTEEVMRWMQESQESS